MDQTGGTPGEGSMKSSSRQWYQETVDWETTEAACLLSLQGVRKGRSLAGYGHGAGPQTGSGSADGWWSERSQRPVQRL